MFDFCFSSFTNVIRVRMKSNLFIFGSENLVLTAALEALEASKKESSRMAETIAALQLELHGDSTSTKPDSRKHIWHTLH